VKCKHIRLFYIFSFVFFELSYYNINPLLSYDLAPFLLAYSYYLLYFSISEPLSRLIRFLSFPSFPTVNLPPFVFKMHKIRSYSFVLNSYEECFCINPIWLYGRFNKKSIYWISHSNIGYFQCYYIPGCDAVRFPISLPTFRGNVLPSCSSTNKRKERISQKEITDRTLSGLFLNPEYGGSSMFFRPKHKNRSTQHAYKGKHTR
jgi:hypothetical protein